MYDVIIAGAGPAGCTAAKTLAENGYKVLLAEKFKMPRYKSCSGQLIKKTVDLVQEYFNTEISDSVMCTPTENRGMIFTNDKGRELRFEQPCLNVWRSSFDNWLAERASEYGAEVRDDTSVLSCAENGDFVTVTLRGEKSYTETARYVVNCEGVVGTLKRKLLGNMPRYITTFQTYNQGSIDLDHHYFYAYLQPYLSEYDAWFNVKDELLVLGVAVKDNDKITDYYQRFIDYMKKQHNLQINKQLKTDKWLMPHIFPGCETNLGVGRILFAGEIAGFLNPMGEGISAAMESGYYAARAVMKNFDNAETVISDYRESLKSLHNYMKRQWHFVAGIADTFGNMS
ncbi:MAG: NAD(P)/FAD-dependent oxidoreductase [Ruminococcaceae bacterium]|nr:NAD(P)/FAD-dependent oxidoreductase [Oscillospiraceae bacterium]